MKTDIIIFILCAAGIIHPQQIKRRLQAVFSALNVQPVYNSPYNIKAVKMAFKRVIMPYKKPAALPAKQNARRPALILPAVRCGICLHKILV